MKAKELLEKAKEVKITDEVPEFKGIFIIQQRKLHDSGYRMMYVIGHTDYDEKKKDFNYYLIGTFSDVIDFTPTFERYLIKDYTMCDLHLDINRNGIIHIWTNSSKHLVNVGRCSNCMFEIK